MKKRAYRDSLKFYKDTAKFYRDSAKFYRDYSSLKEAAAAAANMAKKASKVSTSGTSAAELKQISNAAEAVASGSGSVNGLLARIKSFFSSIPAAFKSFFAKIADVIKGLKNRMKANPAVKQEASSDMKKIVAQLEGNGNGSMQSWINKLTKKPAKSMKEYSVEITGKKVPNDELRSLLAKLEKKGGSDASVLNRFAAMA